MPAWWAKHGLRRMTQNWHLKETNLSQGLRNSNDYPCWPNSNSNQIREGNKWSRANSCSNPSNSKNSPLYLTSKSKVYQWKPWLCNLIMLIITTKFAKEVDTWNYKVSKYVAHLPRLKSLGLKSWSKTNSRDSTMH